MSVDLVGPKLHALLECAQENLTDPVDAVFVAAGEVAWDRCGEGAGCAGQLWTRLVGTTPMTGTRRSAAQFMPCGVLGWVHVIAVGVLRCAATVDDQGQPPSPEELTADADQVSQDAADLAAAILCCDEVAMRSVVEWVPLGPEGGCVGGEWQMTIETNVCRCD